ncbi:MAG: response regulator transcription factor [Dehalococcoidales bacterium]|nr:response regulator transcription factor [Dehalococcoidales bacterium]
MGEKNQMVKLYIIEEQRIFNNVYKEVFLPLNSIYLMGINNNTDLDAIKPEIKSLDPNVLFISIKRLDANLVENLKEIRAEFPNMSFVVSFISHNAQNIIALRKLTAGSQCGMALLLKQSVDRAEQLCNVIKAVNEGQVILDSMITDLIFSERDQGPIKELTPRERRIIDLISKGFTNSSIAKALYIDIRTVQHHINNIYSKLKEEPDFNTGHPRVSAARIYLETTGELLTCGTQEVVKSSRN